jgi:uncharacterized protein YgbK (DUF1537 family)
VLLDSILDEIAPGIPVSLIIGGKYDGVRIVTKAGAFGDENSLLTALRYLKKAGISKTT